MSKRNQQPDYAAELEQAYKRWDFLHEHGGSDPFWPDGVNLNLVRNHIIYCKEQLAQQENTLFGIPDIYYRETPPKVDGGYMARPDEIREYARKAMEIIDADENLKFIREQSPSLSAQQLKQWCIPAIINYAENLRHAIDEDDLVTMRQYRTPERYLEDFESAALKIRNPESTRQTNGNRADCVSEDGEEFEDDEDIWGDECSETEQADDPDESTEEQQGFAQITLF